MPYVYCWSTPWFPSASYIRFCFTPALLQLQLYLYARPACVAWFSLPTRTGFDLYIHQWYFSGYLRCWLGHTSSVHRSQNPGVLLVRRLPWPSWDAISLRAVILLRRYYFTSSDVKILLLESELVLTIIIGEQKEYKIKIAYKKNQLYILLFLF
jgi:hypothetical protein